jgi:hypothetical protein
MSLESTTTIAGLVAANPTAGDPFSQGDDHLRLLKTVLKTMFPGTGGSGFASAITATEAELNYVHGVTSAIQSQLTAISDSIATRVPSGVILLWHGALATIPAGWYFCNGTNGTPDLTGRFPLCYDGVAYPTMFATGGYTDGQILTHTHVATSTPNITGLSTSATTHTHTTDAPTDHTHSYSTVVSGGSTLAGGSGYSISTASTGVGTVHTHTVSGGSHFHDVTGTMTVATTNAAPAGAVAVTGRNMPPYMVLAYIMKS